MDDMDDFLFPPKITKRQAIEDAEKLFSGMRVCAVLREEIAENDNIHVKSKYTKIITELEKDAEHEINTVLQWFRQNAD